MAEVPIAFKLKSADTLRAINLALGTQLENLPQATYAQVIEAAFILANPNSGLNQRANLDEKIRQSVRETWAGINYSLTRERPGRHQVRIFEEEAKAPDERLIYAWPPLEQSYTARRIHEAFSDADTKNSFHAAYHVLESSWHRSVQGKELSDKRHKNGISHSISEQKVLLNDWIREKDQSSRIAPPPFGQELKSFLFTRHTEPNTRLLDRASVLVREAPGKARQKFESVTFQIRQAVESQKAKSLAFSSSLAGIAIITGTGVPHLIELLKH